MSKRPTHSPAAVFAWDPTAQGSLQSDVLSWLAAEETSSRTGQIWQRLFCTRDTRALIWANREKYRRWLSHCAWCSQTTTLAPLPTLSIIAVLHDNVLLPVRTVTIINKVYKRQKWTLQINSLVTNGSIILHLTAPDLAVDSVYQSTDFYNDYHIF